MAQLKNVVEPFGEVNVFPSRPGFVRVRATILIEPNREGTQTGIAIDGSGSMANWYGVRSGGTVSPVFSTRKPLENIVSPVAQKLCAHLARTLDADGGTTCIYWATGAGGSEIEEVGDFTADAVESHTFGPPKKFGTGTQLLPAIQYFAQRFADAPWGFYVFITDGELHDLDAVKDYTRKLARAIAMKKRRPLKFVLIGVGSDVNERQMSELDDLDTGTDIDLWDHKLAAEMRTINDIFAEAIEHNARVADKGKITNPEGKTIKDFSDTGVPGVIEFEAPVNQPYFTLEVNDHRIHQGLSDTAKVPASEMMAELVEEDTTQQSPPKPTNTDGGNEGEMFEFTLELDDDHKK